MVATGQRERRRTHRAIPAQKPYGMARWACSCWSDWQHGHRIHHLDNALSSERRQHHPATTPRQSAYWYDHTETGMHTTVAIKNKRFGKRLISSVLRDRVSSKNSALVKRGLFFSWRALFFFVPSVRLSPLPLAWTRLTSTPARHRSRAEQSIISLTRDRSQRRILFAKACNNLRVKEYHQRPSPIRIAKASVSRLLRLTKMPQGQPRR